MDGASTSRSFFGQCLLCINITTQGQPAFKRHRYLSVSCPILLVIDTITFSGHSNGIDRTNSKSLKVVGLLFVKGKVISQTSLVLSVYHYLLLLLISQSGKATRRARWKWQKKHEEDTPPLPGPHLDSWGTAVTSLKWGMGHSEKENPETPGFHCGEVQHLLRS